MQASTSPGNKDAERLAAILDGVLASGRTELNSDEVDSVLELDSMALLAEGSVSLVNTREFGLVLEAEGRKVSPGLEQMPELPGVSVEAAERLAAVCNGVTSIGDVGGAEIEEFRPGGSFRIGPRVEPRLPRPVGKIDRLLHPQKIGIVGVSGTKMNFGRIILKNIIANGYSPENILIVKPGEEKEIDGVRCVPDLASLREKLDLFIVAVGAGAVFGIVDEVIAADAADSVLLIPGGLGETEASRDPAADMMARINESRRGDGEGPIFIGGNCLGVVSHPGNFDSWFIPRELLPSGQRRANRNSALVSQSGAFMITRLSKNAWLDPAYMAAVGNQNDITHADMLSYFAARDDIDVIGFYIEGFRDLDGLAFARAAEHARSAGKQVVVYKAGQTAAGQGATMGHTASIAGDYEVCSDILVQAGVMVADDFDEFSDLMYIASTLHDKELGGNRVGGISGAGFETVGIADSIGRGEQALEMAVLTDATQERLAEILREKRLDALMEIRNPFDINPGADDEAHLQCAEAFAADPGVDSVVVGLDPLSPVTRTLDKSVREGHDIHSEESLATIFPPFVNECTKPVIGIIEGGPMFEPFTAKLRDQGVCVFNSTRRGVTALRKYTWARIGNR